MLQWNISPDEVAQLQKKFFLAIGYYPCFRSGIIILYYMLPKKSILDRFYGQKSKICQKIPKIGQKLPIFERSMPFHG